MKDRKVKKKKILSGVGTSGREEGKQRGWRRANAVDVFCLDVQK
jgi:hypothetical protein